MCVVFWFVVVVVVVCLFLFVCLFIVLLGVFCAQFCRYKDRRGHWLTQPPWMLLNMLQTESALLVLSEEKENFQDKLALTPPRSLSPAHAPNHLLKHGPRGILERWSRTGVGLFELCDIIAHRTYSARLSNNLGLVFERAVAFSPPLQFWLSSQTAVPTSH